jgi:hypothetical protein
VDDLNVLEHLDAKQEAILQVNVGVVVPVPEELCVNDE